MDIILDSNIILEDPTFVRAQFRELFAYLRRTNSRMVIPTTVRDEVQVRFRERLSEYIQEARDAWEHARKLSGGTYSALPDLDVSWAIKSLLTRMQHPNRDVPDSFFPELQEIDFNEVVRRGIERRRPASAKGEELRDVVLWLHVKRYASERRAEIAFVTRDLGFRISKDEQALHPELAAELQGLLVSFHVDIGSFLRTHALTEHAITEAWLSQFLRLSDLRRVATTMLLREGAAYGTVEHAEIDSLELSKGTEYRITPVSSYVEATYKGTGSLRIAPNVFTTSFAVGQGNLLTYQFAKPLPWNVLTYQAVQPSLDEGVDYSLLLKGPAYVVNAFGDMSKTVGAQPTAPAESRKCIFTLGVSGRMENEKMVGGQIDDLQITHMTSLILTD